MSTCDRAEALRDYAFDELPAGERREMEEHIGGCGVCAAELDQLRVTAAALRLLPDQEIPQRIAFVSDKVFTPSPVARFFEGFWNSAARLGFASACVLGGALIVFAYHRPPERAAERPAHEQKEVRNVAQTADVAKQVNEAVARAAAQIREEDARLLAAAEAKHQEEHRTLMEAVTVLQDHLNTNTLLEVAAQ